MKTFTEYLKDTLKPKKPEEKKEYDETAINSTFQTHSHIQKVQSTVNQAKEAKE